ncbi:hypothetical protein MTP99_010672 [Tenebrio molitor]|nr:hypothetical protein MTP99_010672 [Tenebrio molitor]
MLPSDASVDWTPRRPWHGSITHHHARCSSRNAISRRGRKCPRYLKKGFESAVGKAPRGPTGDVLGVLKTYGTHENRRSRLG